MQDTKQQKREIEIVPWRHNILTSAHRDIIKYLETIPRGSTIFLELQPELLAHWEKFIQSGETLNVGAPNISLAIMELISTAILQGHNVVPVDFKLARKGIFSLDYSEVGGISIESISEKKKRVAVNRLREKVMVRNMIASRVKKGYFVCGVGHVKQIEKDLNDNNINVRTNLGIFEDKVDVESRINIYFQYYKAIRYDQLDNVLRLEQRIAILDRTAKIIGLSFAQKKALDKILTVRRKILLKRLERHKKRNPLFFSRDDLENTLREKQKAEKARAKTIAKSRKPI